MSRARALSGRRGMTIDLENYRGLYLDEARENVAAFQAALSLDPPYARAVIDELFRRAHSIKGMSAAMGVEPVRDLSHTIEDVLAPCRAGETALATGHRDALREAADYLATQLDAYENRRDLPACAPARTALLAASAVTAPTARVVASPTPRPSPSAAPKARPGATVRVDAGDLDRLMEWTTELALTVANLLCTLPITAGADADPALVVLTRTCRRLQETTLRMRLARLDVLAHQVGRAARETAARLGKSAELTFDSGDVAVDRAILEALHDPLIHLIRNAIDHGLESPAERAACGKPAIGRLTLTARHEEDAVRIQLEDDGRGIDRAALRRKAEKLGLHPTDDRELLLLTTIPGLSTRAEVSETSGRGVGMDLARTRIEELGGRIELTSEAGSGTVVTLRAPLTLVRQRLVLVRLGDVAYAVPRTRLIRVLETPLGEAPVINLAERLGVAGGTAFSLIVRDGDGREHHLGVDQVLAEPELVVRPLGRPLQRLPTFSGAALLPGGGIALVLDTEAILRSAGRCGAAPEASAPPAVQALASMSLT